MDKNSNDVNPAPQKLDTSDGNDVKQDTGPFEPSAQNKQEAKNSPNISKVIPNSNADSGLQPSENRVFINSAAETSQKTPEANQ